MICAVVSLSVLESTEMSKGLAVLSNNIFDVGSHPIKHHG